MQLEVQEILQIKEIGLQEHGIILLEVIKHTIEL
jgi:hypothetical protein